MFKNFFLKKATLVFSGTAAVICWVLWGLAVFFHNEGIALVIYAGIFASLTGGLLLAYFKGQTNIQKMLFGALLMFLLWEFIDLTMVFYSIGFYVWSALIGVVMVCSLLVFICHMIQQSEHSGKMTAVTINQLCFVVIAIWVAYLVSKIVRGTLAPTDFPCAVSIMATYLMIVCMETRICEYKKLRAENRANGAWTEEKRKEAKEIFKL